MNGAMNTDCAFSAMASPHHISERIDWPRTIEATAKTQAPDHKASHWASRAALSTAGGRMKRKIALRGLPPAALIRSASANAAKAVPATDKALIRYIGDISSWNSDMIAIK